MTDKIEAKDVVSAVFDYLRSHPEVHTEPVRKVVKDALKLAFSCE